MTGSTGARRPRYAELTYSSGARGFQVQDTRGEMSEDEREALVAFIATGADFGVPVPEFPTAAEVACLPRKLAYAPLPPFGFAYWHTAPAGRDQSDRPGNVFAHVVLDRGATGAVESARPIERWLAAEWLRPFGATEVSAAKLEGRDHGGPGGPVSRAAVVEFLIDPAHRRVGLFAVLLDAFRAAWNDGRHVVLGTESADNAAMWIGAISYFMSPGTARLFGWSVLESSSTAAAAFRRGCHLVCVPRSDLADRARLDAVVIVEAADVELGEWPHTPHRDSRGNGVPCSPWSTMATVLLSAGDDPVAALEEVDRIAIRVGDQGLDPGWPMAMLVAQNTDLLPGAVPAACEVVAKSSPRELLTATDLMASALQLVTIQMGGSTADAWSALTAVSESSGAAAFGEMLWETYVARAVLDRDWLCGVEPPPHAILSVRPHSHATFERAVSDALEQVRRESSADPANAGLWAARLIDFVLTEGAVRSAEEQAALEDQLQNLLEQRLLPLIGPGDRAVLDRIGTLNDRTLASVVRPVFMTDSMMNAAPVGCRVQKHVLKWLFPHGLSGLTEDLALTYDNPPSVLELELAVVTVSDSTPTPEDSDAARHVTLRALGTEAWGAADPEQVLDQVQGGQPIPISEAIDCLRHRGSRLPARMVARSLVRGSPTDPAHRLLLDLAVREYAEADPGAGSAGPDPGRELLFDTVRLFDLKGETPWRAASTEEASSIAEGVIQTARGVCQHEHRLPPSTIAGVLAALAVQHSLRRTTSPYQRDDCDLLEFLTPSDAVDVPVAARLVGEFLQIAVDEGKLGAVAGVARLAMVGRADFPIPSLKSTVATALAEFVVVSGDPPMSFLDAALRDLLGEWDKPQFNELEDFVVGKLAADLQETLPNWERDESGRLPKDTKVFLKSWFKQVASEGGWFRRRRQARGKGTTA